LTVLSVAYPFAPIAPDPVGGAEQILARLDHALTAAGHRSIVIAPEGSLTCGRLRSVPRARAPITDPVRDEIYGAVRKRIDEAIERDRPDVVHLHGLDFDRYLPASGPPVVVTLHLPLEWYAAEALRPARADVALHPVSEDQARRAPAGARLAAPIANGVAIPRERARKRRFALTLGRVCPEKGFDDAIAASRLASMPLLLAGTVFPYEAHQQHFATRIAPQLDRGRRWIGAVAGPCKQRLLAKARCVLVPSKVPETSSLVAMEALAAGTPVIAYRAGALPEIVAHGRTGFLVHSIAGMAQAMQMADGIDGETCRQEAQARFPLEKMTRAYLARYAELAGH
jgi:glycosyltransferase involved in cell wall biosynthesis